MIQLIQFLKPEYHPKAWGKGETWIINSDKYCAKILEFKAGGQASKHMHADKEECWYIVEGQLLMKYFDFQKAEEIEITLNKGDIVNIPPYNPHQVTAIVDTTLWETSTKHDEADVYRLSKGDSQRV